MTRLHQIRGGPLALSAGVADVARQSIIVGRLNRRSKPGKLHLAERLAETQSFISKCERGERRIDIADLPEFYIAMDTTLEKFIRGFERKIG